MATATNPLLDERLTLVFGGDPEVARDPFAVFDALREQGPVYRTDTRVLALGHARARELFADNGERCNRGGIATSATARAARERMAPAEQTLYDELLAFERLQMRQNEGPVHERLRRIAHRAFIPARTSALAETIQAHADEILDAVVRDDGPFDLQTFAYQLPLRVMAGLLGIPEGDIPLIHEWSVPIGRAKGATSSGAIDAEIVVAAHAGIQSFREYVDAIVAQHRGAPPQTELIAALIDAEEDERLAADELTAMFVVLLFAGHETTSNLIGTGMHELLRAGARWDELCADPALAPAAVEELLRFVTPVQWLETSAVRDFEVEGVTVREGDTVLMVCASANRDPEVFPHPERLDFGRAENKLHLSLGFGPHFCLGSSLARLEATIAFGTLAGRYPELRSAGEPDWRGGMLRGVTRLPVQLG